MENFLDFNIPQWLKDSLSSMGYSKPTPIQEQAIPHVLEGKDVLGSAQTGTGKTGAFLVPLIAFLDSNPNATALVLTPTRELAVQVNTVAMQMLKANRQIRTALLIGGDPMAKQFFQLKQKPRLIVGTPGRINDHIQRKSVDLSKTSFVVLDETDRMLDMGFGIQIDEIFKYTEQKKQTLLFSATLPKEIVRLVDDYLVDPVRISAGEVNTVATKVSQEIIKTKDKAGELLKLLPTFDGTTIIFVRTQRGADAMRMTLRKEGYKAEAIHGGLKQGKRTNVLKDFRAKRFNILVATDVASRGLDIDHISYVINYDMPDNPEDYVHRIGRTARGNKEGASYSLVAPAEEIKWRAVQRFLDPEAYKKENPSNSGRRNSGRNQGGFGKPYGNGNSKGGFNSKHKHSGSSWHTNRSESGEGFRSERSDNGDRRGNSGSNKPFGFGNQNGGDRRGNSGSNKPFGFGNDRPNRGSNDRHFGGERSDRRDNGFGNGNNSNRNGNRRFDDRSSDGNKKDFRKDVNGNSKFSGKRDERISDTGALDKIKNLFAMNKKGK